jgi:hypothetical protein
MYSIISPGAVQRRAVELRRVAVALGCRLGRTRHAPATAALHRRRAVLDAQWQFEHLARFFGQWQWLS